MATSNPMVLTISDNAHARWLKTVDIRGGIPLAELPARLAEHMAGWEEALPPAVFRAWTQVVACVIFCCTYQYLQSTYIPLLGPGIKLFNPIALYIKAGLYFFQACLVEEMASRGMPAPAIQGHNRPLPGNGLVLYMTSTPTVTGHLD